MDGVVDSQVHIWAPGAADPSRDPSGAGVTGERTIRLLDGAGVGAAVLVSPSSVYGFDSSYALDVAGRHPERFRVVGPVDLSAPDAVEAVDRWAADGRTIGLRLIVRDERDAALVASPSGRRVLDAIAARGVPLNVWPPGNVACVGDLARRHPDLRVVVDHTGIDFTAGGTAAVGSRLRTEGERLLGLAGLPNVAVKASGTPALSGEAYPFRDVWPWVVRIVEAFGAHRVLWGSDWTRLRNRCDYADNLTWLTDAGLFGGADLEWLLAGAARAVYGWPLRVAQAELVDERLEGR